MTLLTPLLVSDATGLRLATGGQDGACEKAVAWEPEARLLAVEAVTTPAVAHVEGLYLAAEALRLSGLPPDPVAASRGTRYAHALARLALGRAAPFLGLRSVNQGGFVASVGPNGSEALLSPRQVADAVALTDASALSTLRALVAEALADGSFVPPVSVPRRVAVSTVWAF